MSDEPEKNEVQARLDRMDKVADSLLKLIESEETDEAQKGRLFAQVMAWYKLRKSLVPPEEGGKLKEMKDVLTKDRSRNRVSERAISRAREGHAIEKIIRQLPAVDRGLGGDQAHSQRPGGGAPGNGSGVRVDGVGNVDRDDDGAVDRPVV
jgi:hypothetical protein